MMMLDDPQQDVGLDAVEATLTAIHGWRALVREGIARAVDEIVDPVRSRRWSLNQLEQPEKTSIGTRVENILRMDLELPRGNVLDLQLAGHEVDIKFTIGGNWMIPPEATDHICLLTSYDATGRTVSAGLLRTDANALGGGQNRDRKRSVSQTGRARIRWLISAETPELSIIGFMAALEPALRDRVTDTSVGAQERLNRLFLALRGQLIPETLVEAVAQHRDWTRRLRPDAANPNGPEQRGYKVLRQSSPEHRTIVARMGLPLLPRGYCMPVGLEDLR